MISRETIDGITSQANLIDLIGESVALKRRGGNYVGLCPFHSEKTPSFTVRESGQSYYCFGCGASGDVFSYVMESRGLSFPEAVEDLASRYGVAVKYEGKDWKKLPKSNAPELYALNAEAVRFFRSELKKNLSAGAEYLRSRGLSSGVIEEFEIGFAPDSWSALTDLLIGKGYSQDLVVRAGLVKKHPSGRLYDAFRGRIIFPIRIDTKRIAGFGGRFIPALFPEEKQKTMPKYINSPENEVYVKRRILYGLHAATPFIRESGEVYLVEGYMDVVSLWQAGVKNCAAACGTSVTTDHAKRLSRLAKKIIVLFDGDRAGKGAAAKMFSSILNTGIDAEAVFLEEGEDPDSIACKNGSGTGPYLTSLPSQSLFECYLNGILEQYNVQDASKLGAAARGKASMEVSKVLRQIENPVERDLLKDFASNKLGVNLGKVVTIRKEPAETLREEHIGDGDEKIEFKRLPPVDRELIKAVMTRHDLADKILRNSLICKSLHHTALQFVYGLSEVFNGEKDKDVQKERVKGLLSVFGDSWKAAWRDAYRMSHDANVDMYSVYEECVKTIKRRQIEAEIAEADRELKSGADAEKKRQLAREKLALARKLKEIS